MLVFPDNTAVSTYVLSTLIGRFKEIRNYTVAHTAPMELVVRVYASPALSQDRQNALTGDIASHVPKNVCIRYESLDERLPAGKRAAIRREF
jgi:hypothetical protein